MSNVNAAIKASFAHFEAGRVELARDILADLCARHPDDAHVLCNYAVFLTKVGSFDEAERHARRAVEVEPHKVRGFAILTSVYFRLNRPDAALEACRRMARIAPENPHVRRALASALLRANDFFGAAEVARGALAATPRDADLWMKLGAALLTLGRIDEVTRALDQADAACPGDVGLAQLRAVVSNYAPDLEPGPIFEAHRRFGDRLARAQADGASHPRPPPVDLAAGEDRPLRVGLVSSDLWQHSVVHFARALFEHHAASGVELFAYHTGPIEDAMTITLRTALPPARFRRATAISPDALDEMIRRDAIDVLVDLNGLTRDHCLHTLLRRPAPLLVTYLGYPNTTGLSVVDARIVDALTDPPGIAESSCTEALVRLDPCFVCFTPPDSVPAVSAAPAGGGRAPITFGSFNALSKLNDRLLALWADVLAAVPDARLLLKSCGVEHAAVHDDLYARAIAAGIPRQRLELAGTTAEHSHHLAAYGRIDVALDSFPYHGTTTTCDALLMGVPVVTLAGPTHASRVGVSLLRAVGLGELCARSREHYVELAAAMARDHDRRARLRAELRPRLLTSPLCDGPRFAARFFTAISRLWRDRASRGPMQSHSRIAT